MTATLAPHPRATGRYYTPSALVDAVLDASLEPLLDAVCTRSDARDGLARLRIVDPSCGDGRFLVAAARRVARRLERAGSAAPLAVAAGTVHGVDIDPAAVAAARAALAALGASPDACAAQVRRGDALLGRSLLDTPADAGFGSDGGLDWADAFPAVRDAGGFDAVVGNPPWIAHSGRAAQPLDPDVREAYRARFAAFRGYPTTHACFIERCAGLLRPGGRLGLLVPASVLQLGGYAETRRAHDRLCRTDDALPCFGEGRFEGVTQPCAALVSTRRAASLDAPDGRAWAADDHHLDDVGRALLLRVASWAPLPDGLFAERGLRAPPSAFTTDARAGGIPVRAGRDVGAYALAPPRLWTDDVGASAVALDGVAFVVRQTARFPIAARADGAWFRNSLLAGIEVPGWPADLLVALLNASFVRWLHHARFLDARQPVLPQVKLSHLRAVPMPRALDPHAREELLCRSAAASARNHGLTDDEAHAIDALVADAYGLDATERACVRRWARDTSRGCT